MLVILLKAVVVTVGRSCVLNVISALLYEVPFAFIAYALAKYCVPAVKPVIVPVKTPVPEPFIVESRHEPRAGLAEVLQQRPLAVTVSPPLEVTSPFSLADVMEISDTVPAVTVAVSVSLVVKLSISSA